MDPTLLIDAVVRQTMVLVAQLATAGGARASLARTANKVFLDLVVELKRQGLGNKLIADMFGLALRTYHERVQRLAESETSQGRSLWEAVLSYLQERGVASRADVLGKFVSDDERTVRSVLSDLVETGLVYRTGRGDATSYRAPDPNDGAAATSEQRVEGLAHWVHLAISGAEPVDREALERRLDWGGTPLDEALARLVDSGRIETTEGPSGRRYSSPGMVIPYGTPAGWEAAVFDHFQTMVTTIVAKLRQGARHANADALTGGSTYRFEFWRGHPLEQEVLGLLASFRRQASLLRSRVVEYNHAHPEEATKWAEDGLSVVAYVGQNVRAADERDDQDDSSEDG